MAKDREPINYGKFINQFLTNIIKSIRQFEKINTKICIVVKWLQSQKNGPGEPGPNSRRGNLHFIYY